MKIAFDAKRALVNKSGLGAYSRNLLNALQNFYPQHEYHLFSPAVNDSLKRELNGEFHYHFPERFFDKKFKSYWRSFSMLNQIPNDCNVFHGLSNEIPFSKPKLNSPKIIVTIHDLIFKKYPEQYPLFDRTVYDLKSKYACRNAHKIIACSEETKEDIIQFYKINAEKINVIYQSCHPSFFKKCRQEVIDNIKIKFSLPNKYILHIGSFNKRKNHFNLLKAFAQISKQTEVDLVFIGSEGDMLPVIRKEIHRLQLENRVHIIQGVSNLLLPAVYQAAEMFVFPSFFEGFGIPALEAMASNCPLLVSNGTCFYEVAQDAALYFNPYDSESIAEKIKLVLNNQTLKTDLIEKGNLRADELSPNKFAKNIIESYFI